MSDGFRYRELVKAMVGYGEETVEEVQARHAAQDKEPTRGSKEPPGVSSAPPPKKEMDKLALLMANAKPHPQTPVD